MAVIEFVDRDTQAKKVDVKKKDVNKETQKTTPKEEKVDKKKSSA